MTVEDARPEAYPERIGGREGIALGEITPDRETFRALAARQRVVPVSVRLLADEDTPVSLYRRLTADGDGRGTFFGGDPAGVEMGAMVVVDAEGTVIGTLSAARLNTELERSGLIRPDGSAR